MRITLQIHDNVVVAIEKIKGVSDSAIELELPQGSLLFENGLNLKLLRKEAEKVGKSVVFVTIDDLGKSLIQALDAPLPRDFVPKEVALGTATVKQKRKLPSFPKISLKLPALAANYKAIVLTMIGVGIAAGLFYLTLWKVPKARVEILVNSQPLTKSVELKAVKDASTNAEKRIIKGMIAQTVVTEKLSLAATGQKLVGDKAAGKIKIFNKTDAEIKLKEGGEVTYKEHSPDLVYKLTGDVTIAARTEQTPGDPSSPLIPGETTVGVTAADIGDDYNIADDKTLEVSDYKQSELVAQTDGKMAGGSSETVSVVTQEDKTNLSSKLLEQITQGSQKSLDAKLGTGQKRIAGSEIHSVVSEEYSADVGDEIEVIELTQEVGVTALTYFADDLNKLVDELVKGFVPDGFVLSSEQREVGVEVLGNTDSSTLSAAEADLQVTLKTLVVPSINEADLKKELAGKGMPEAQRILGSTRNAKSYEIKFSPNIPFFQRMPQSVENIELVIKKN